MFSVDWLNPSQYAWKCVGYLGFRHTDCQKYMQFRETFVFLTIYCVILIKAVVCKNDDFDETMYEKQ